MPMGAWGRVVYVWELIIEPNLVETRFVYLIEPCLDFFMLVFVAGVCGSFRPLFSIVTIA